LWLPQLWFLEYPSFRRFRPFFDISQQTEGSLHKTEKPQQKPLWKRGKKPQTWHSPSNAFEAYLLGNQSKENHKSKPQDTENATGDSRLYTEVLLS
jgi:hypothetical protein